MYGYFEAKATNAALRTILNKRPFVLSRSTFAGSGHYTGHWSGDNDASFTDLYRAIPAILNYNIFGLTLSGADICGFNGDTTEELCTIWMQLGAFYPFMRNHNVIGAKNSSTVHAYVPQDVWYEFSSGKQITTVGQYVDFDAPIRKINVHVRCGFIIPMQIPGPNLVIGRGNPFILLVALSQSGNASGSLFWDDGDSMDTIETKTYNYFEFNVTASVSI
ncbi:unnamed protein product [Rotaria sp. Silwood2]|nr:unnamed protein product [Rotaria sp. Silwood2]CAF4565352.1 unnamed protein product [Rotaria sp. Silwood2]